VVTVAVTGATGIFGRALCARLQDDEDVERIIGIARRPFDPAAHGWSKMVFRSADVTDAEALDAALAGAEVVCHLAFIVATHGMDRERARAINVDGSRIVFDAALRAGAGRIVYASSIAAYGAHADNPLPITEDHPTRGQDDMAYSADKAAVERILDDVEIANPGVEIVRIRPCVVVGPNSVDLFRGPVPPWLVGLLLSPAVPWVLPDPGIAPLQLVHEEDVAEVFALAITRPGVRGAFNLAGGGIIEPAELAKRLGAVRLPVPAGLARRVVDVAHAVRLAPTRGDWIEAARHPIIVDTTRAREELGWVPRYDTRTALEDLLDRYRRAVSR
jgi:nucleoside-diphosphate-sugar epimerase